MVGEMVILGVPENLSPFVDLRDAALKAYHAMVLARVFDMKMSSLYKGGKISGGVFSGKGHEAIAAAEGVFLRAGTDIYSPFIREQAGRIAWGEPIIEGVRAYFGSVLGAMRGRDGNVHRGAPDKGYIANISHLGTGIAVVVGGLLAKRMDGKVPGAVGLACYGDGTTSTGAFHEAVNLAAVENLPLVMVVTNNQFAYSTPNNRQFACASLLDRGRGYGYAVHEVDGTIFLETLRVMKAAIDAARVGGGPQWVLATTLRMCGHGEHDDAAYIPKEIRAMFRDPLDVAKEQLIEQGWMTAAEADGVHDDAVNEVQRAVAQAQREPEPDPFCEDWTATLWQPNE